MNQVAAYWQLGKMGLWPAVEAEFRRHVFAEAEQRSRSGLVQHRPRLEARKARLAIYTRTLERKEQGEA
jgi:hypothetical protein